MYSYHLSSEAKEDLRSILLWVWQGKLSFSLMGAKIATSRGSRPPIINETADAKLAARGLACVPSSSLAWV